MICLLRLRTIVIIYTKLLLLSTISTWAESNQGKADKAGTVTTALRSARTVNAEEVREQGVHSGVEEIIDIIIETILSGMIGLIISHGRGKMANHSTKTRMSNMSKNQEEIKNMQAKATKIKT